MLVELDQNRPLGIFEYARLKIYINELLGGAGDVVNRKTLKPLLRDGILRDAVHRPDRCRRGGKRSPARI